MVFPQVSDGDTLSDASRVRRALFPLVLALAMFGYPLVGNVVSLLEIDGRALSVPFRLFVLCLSLLLLVSCRYIRITRARRFLFLIWLAYALRLTYDLMVARLEGADYALQFFLVACVLPAFALLAADDFQQDRFAKLAFAIAVTGCAATVVGSWLGRFGETDLTQTTGRLSTLALNPVSLGHLAVSAVLCGFVLWRRAGTGILLRASILAGCLVAMYCLVMTGSKGPALALVICVTAWAAARGFLLKILIVGIPLVVLILLSPVSPLADRLAGLGEDPSTLERVVLLRDTFRQVADSPLLGSAFVELNSGLYPHNMLLDAALAFGIPLALGFTWLVAIGAIRAWGTLRTPEDLLGLLFVQTLVGGLVSGALFGATGFWCLLALLLGPGYGRSALARSV